MEEQATAVMEEQAADAYGEIRRRNGCHRGQEKQLPSWSSNYLIFLDLIFLDFIFLDLILINLISIDLIILDL